MGGIIVFGAGGHGHVVIDALQSSNVQDRCVIVDADPDRWHRTVLNVPVVGGDNEVELLRQQGFDQFVIAIGGLKQLRLRRKLYLTAIQHGLQPVRIRHASAVCSIHAEVSDGVQLHAGSIVNPLARIGVNCIINTAAVIEHDCVVGAHSHVAPRACLAGNVVVGEEVHVGMGALIREGIQVGDRAVIGAGAVVVRDVPPKMVVVGIPAKEIRKSTE